MPTWLEYNRMLIDSCWCVIHIILNYSTYTCSTVLFRPFSENGRDSWIWFCTRVKRRPNAQEHQPLFGEKDKALQCVIVWVWSPSFSQTPGEERAQLRMEQQQLSSTAPVNTLAPDSMTIWLYLLTEDQRYSGLCFSLVLFQCQMWTSAWGRWAQLSIDTVLTIISYRFRLYTRHDHDRCVQGGELVVAGWCFFPCL